ncbi:deoxyhypusine synthase [archaeon]|jgi:deoxyhypusine synthase|nr:deoxyhypusine synthase [archaeon]MDP6547931.1 deoxyhypusine synthase family protein [Candidatus Woesearchaeota archaeon]|tara:strand:+ start:114243 stop:115232 length:990 start_codon:yes stop_codon:yes gene_type:complete
MAESVGDFKAVKDFIGKNFKHFNASVVVSAADAYKKYIDNGGKMLITLAGAMSTAELGISLAEMIRKGKVHGICATAANLEEDLFNLVAHSFYKKVPNYRDLTPKDEEQLLKNKLNRVTDTCIPEEEAMRRIENHLIDLWKKADKDKKRYFPYEFMYMLIDEGTLEKYYEIDPKDSWVIAACEAKIPIFTPGYEDSTLGNVYAAQVIKGVVSNPHVVKNGIEQMAHLVEWYKENSKDNSIGFFQIGGGIAGDFPICVVPLIQQDLFEECKLWGYFCQISDSTTSYGSYSGAVPNEKITWGKLGIDTLKFVIESDATIVAPLIFAYVLAE